MGDVEVLRQQVYLFAQLYRAGLQLSGIIYLHPITRNRVSGSSARNFRMLEQLCGHEGLPRLILLSTMWDQLEPRSSQYLDALYREQELVTNDIFWASMCRGGSLVENFDGSSTSASAVVSQLIARTRGRASVAFQIQRELVDEGRDLLQTSAARELSKHLNQAYSKINDDLKQTAAKIEAEREAADQMLSRRKKDLEEAIRRLNSTREDLYRDIQAQYSKLLLQAAAEQQTLQKEVQRWISQCARLEEEVKANNELYSQEQESQQLWIRRSDARINLQAEQAEFKRQYLEEQQRLEDKKLALEKAQRQKKRRILLKQNIVPILQILAGGIGVGVSIPFGVFPVTGAAATAMAAGIAGLKFSTKDRSKPTEHEEAYDVDDALSSDWSENSS